jgi:hypothetical protein
MFVGAKEIAFQTQFPEIDAEEEALVRSKGQTSLVTVARKLTEWAPEKTWRSFHAYTQNRDAALSQEQKFQQKSFPLLV